MLRDQIKELLSESDYPSVTITLPTHRTAPDNEKDRIRLKNLADDARDLINAELRGRVANLERAAAPKRGPPRAAP